MCPIVLNTFVHNIFFILSKFFFDIPPHRDVTNARYKTLYCRTRDNVLSRSINVSLGMSINGDGPAGSCLVDK